MLQPKREMIIPEAVKELIKGMHSNEPAHIRENYKTRLEDMADYINKEIHKFNSRDMTFWK